MLLPINEHSPGCYAFGFAHESYTGIVYVAPAGSVVELFGVGYWLGDDVPPDVGASVLRARLHVWRLGPRC